MRNHLYRFPQIFAIAFFGEDIPIYLSRRQMKRRTSNEYQVYFCNRRRGIRFGKRHHRSFTGEAVKGERVEGNCAKVVPPATVLFVSAATKCIAAIVKRSPASPV